MGRHLLDRINTLVWLMILGSGYTSATWAQTLVKGGGITFQADTVQRIVARPGKFYPVKMTIYGKGNLARQELMMVNRYNRSDTAWTIQIRNSAGIYLCTKSNLSTDKIAILMTYEDEKSENERLIKAGYVRTYNIQTTNRRAKWLGVESRWVVFTDSLANEHTDALVSDVLSVPVATFFNRLSSLKATPVQFSVREEEWVMRYTATKIEQATPLDHLFAVPSDFMVMGFQELKSLGEETK